MLVQFCTVVVLTECMYDFVHGTQLTACLLGYLIACKRSMGTGLSQDIHEYAVIGRVNNMSALMVA